MCLYVLFGWLFICLRLVYVSVSVLRALWDAVFLFLTFNQNGKYQPARQTWSLRARQANINAPLLLPALSLLTLDQCPRPASLQPPAARLPAGQRKPTSNQASSTKLLSLKLSPFLILSQPVWHQWSQGVGAECGEKPLVQSHIRLFVRSILAFAARGKSWIKKWNHFIEDLFVFFSSSVSSTGNVVLKFKYAGAHLFRQPRQSLTNVRTMSNFNVELFKRVRDCWWSNLFIFLLL